MLKVIFKIALVIAIAFTLTLGIGTCTKDFIQPANAAETSDWKLCNTKVIIANDTETKHLYRLFWIDHDVPAFTGPMDRAGGELEPLGISYSSKQFRLCPGRHELFWWNLAGPREPTVVKFTVTPNMKQIVLTTKGISVRYDNFYKAPKLEPISFVTGDNVSEIYKMFRDNSSALAKISKVTEYGKLVLIHTGQAVGDTFYTMSLCLTSDGVLLSIDFTKQVTLSEDKVDIYYEGIKVRDGNRYYCYANKLHRDLNCDLTPIPAESIFKQVAEVLFEDKEEI